MSKTGTFLQYPADQEGAAPLLVTQNYPLPVTDYRLEIAKGNVSNASLWNKFGYNNDIDAGTELVASWADAPYTINTTASTIELVSTSANDDVGGTGCNSVVLYGLDANWNEIIEVISLDGLTPVTSSNTFIGLNRIAMFLCGSGQVNDGTVNATKTTGGATVGQLPVGEGVTQQCLFYVPAGKVFLTEYILLNTARISGGSNPVVDFKFWVYSSVSNGKQEVLRVTLDTSIEVNKQINAPLPFPISEKCICWIEATTTLNNTVANCRFSGTIEAE